MLLSFAHSAAHVLACVGSLGVGGVWVVVGGVGSFGRAAGLLVGPVSGGLASGSGLGLGLAPCVWRLALSVAWASLMALPPPLGVGGLCLSLSELACFCRICDCMTDSSVISAANKKIYRE